MKIKDIINKNYNNDFILDIINNTKVDKDAAIIELLNIVNSYNFNLVDDLKFDLRILQNEYDELEADYSDLESSHEELKDNYDDLVSQYKEVTEPLANNNIVLIVDNEQIIKIKKEIEEAKSKKLLNIANQNFESAVVDRDVERALANKLNEYIKNHLLDYIKKL